MCYGEIGLCMQHILTILDTIVNPIGEGIVAYELSLLHPCKTHTPYKVLVVFHSKICVPLH